MVLRVGLTGGIASGKTTVSDIFSLLGVPVIDTDIIAREVVAPGTPGLEQVVAAFGTQVIDSHGQLDRRVLRDIVFADPERRVALERILHPLIRSRTARLLATLDADYVILVVPLLIEAGMREWVDRVLVVDVGRETQIQRLCLRDGIAPEQAEAIMRCQLAREHRLSHADDIIANDSDKLEPLRRAVLELDQHYRTLSQNKSALDSPREPQ